MQQCRSVILCFSGNYPGKQRIQRPADGLATIPQRQQLLAADG